MNACSCTLRSYTWLPFIVVRSAAIRPIIQDSAVENAQLKTPQSPAALEPARSRHATCIHVCIAASQLKHGSFVVTCVRTVVRRLCVLLTDAQFAKSVGIFATPAVDSESNHGMLNAVAERAQISSGKSNENTRAVDVARQRLIKRTARTSVGASIHTKRDRAGHGGSPRGLLAKQRQKTRPSTGVSFGSTCFLREASDVHDAAGVNEISTAGTSISRSIIITETKRTVDQRT